MATTAGDASAPVFFLSYARDDRERGEPQGGLIPRFFGDLSGAVARRSGADSRQVGFFDDVGISLGERWQKTLAWALSSCAVFVALCSPRFYRRPYCAYEWSVFYRRCAVYEQIYQRFPAVLFPLVWIPSPLDKVPHEVSELQWSHEGLGETYARAGIRRMMTISGHNDDYLMFVDDLAGKILAAAESVEDLPVAAPGGAPAGDDVFTWPDGTSTRAERAAGEPRPSEPAVAPQPAGPEAPTVPSPGRGSTTPSTARVSTEPAARPTPSEPAEPDGGMVRPDPAELVGPRVVFAIVAGTETELDGIRRDRQYYGRRRWSDWAPYRPDPGTVHRSAQQVAGAHDFEMRLALRDQDLTTLSLEADAENEIVVIIVDLWTARLEPYRSMLTRYDDYHGPTNAVLIPRNGRDAETAGAADVLDSVLAEVFEKNSLRHPGDVLFQAVLRSDDEFRGSLQAALVEASGRMQRRGAARKLIKGGSRAEPPTLMGPWG